MKKLLKKSLLASVILTTGSAAGIVYISNTLMTEDNSSDFSTSPLAYNVLSEDQIEKHTQDSKYITAVKSNEAELKSEARSSIQTSVNEFNTAITTPDVKEITPQDIFPDLPTSQPGDITEIVAWIEAEAGQTIDELMATITGLGDIVTIPTSDFGKKVIELHNTYEPYFYENVTGDDEYRTYWNDQDNVDFDGTFDYDPKTITWTDWTRVPTYFLDLMVALNPVAGQTFTSHKDVTDYYADVAYTGFKDQLLVNSFAPKPINPDDVLLDLIEPVSAAEIEEIINSFIDNNNYDHITLPTIDIVVPYIPWTDIEHIKSIYEFPFFASTPKEPYPDGDVSAAVIAAVDEKIHNAVLDAMGGNADLAAVVEESVHEALDPLIGPLAADIETAYNAYIVAVANIDTKITEFNLLIDEVNAAVAELNVLVDVVNAEIALINEEIAILEGKINDTLDAISNGLDVDWSEIEGLVNGINAYIDTLNAKITALNDQLTIIITAINAEIEAVFGELDVYFTYTNDTIAYIYESVWYYGQMQLAFQLMNDNQWHLPSDPVVLTNQYQDSTGNTQYHPAADGVSSMEDSEFPFTEVSITDDNGTYDVDTTNPIYTEVTSETYSASYTISVREGGDYEAFDADNIKIYSYDYEPNPGPGEYPTFDTAVEHTFTYEKNATALATGRTTDYMDGGARALGSATYDVYEYTFTVNDLKAGEEYYFYMESNNFTDPELDAYVDGIENSVRVNNTPVIHFMNNDVTQKAGTENITEVSAASTFEIQDDGTYWNLEEDDITVVTTVTGETAPLTPSKNVFTDGASGAPATLELEYLALTPDTSYTTTISTRPYDADDIQWIDEDATPVEQLVVTWTTLPWKDPQPPTVVITDPGKDSLADKKHTRQLDYVITTPGADELTGQDTTEITSIDVYVGLGDYSLPGSEPASYDKVDSITTITNNGGATEAVEEASYLISGLELGTQYSAYVDVQFQGKNDNTHTGNVESNKVVFTTEGLDPALPPYFGKPDAEDTNDGFTFVSSTTDSATLAFDFTDPATPDFTTNTKIESIDYYVEESSKGISETSTPWTDVEVVWDTGEPDNVTDNKVDVQYTGQVTFNGLNPNMDYDFRMDLNSNAIPDIDSDPDLDKITIASPVATGKTLKLDALEPTWDAVVPFEWVSRTENTMTFNYKFNVPENDLTHKNTFFDAITVYYGAAGVATDGLDKELSDTVTSDGTPYYEITPSEEGAVAGPSGETNGDFSGQVVFRNLDPNTTYTFQLGIKSHWYDDDYPAATPTDMPEVFSPIREETTAKLSAKGPWFDETTGGLEFVDTSVVAPAVAGDPNTIQARISYKFFLPPTDDDYFDTLFNNEFKIMLSSTYTAAKAEPEYEATDFSVEQTTTGDITDLGYEHTFIVAAEDGTEYTTTTTEGQMYSGIITLNNLHPEETYTAKMIVSTESANPDTEIDGTTPKDIIDDIESNALPFDSHTLPPKKPYFGKEDDETDGVTFIKGDKTVWSDTVLSFDFDFTIPEKEHGYEEGLLNAVNIYFGTDSAALALAVEGTDYTINWKRTGTDNGDGTFSAALYSGTVTFSGLTANTQYFVQIGIDSNYYEGVDETNLVEVLSPIAAGTTASTKAVPPVILSATVDFDKEKSRFILSMDVRTFNGDSDPLGSVADTLNDVIHVGQIKSDASGNLLDEAGNIVDDPENADPEVFDILEKDYYIGAGGYTVKADENGAGVETVHYDISLLTTKLPFESVINDMIVTLDWKDDGTSYEDQTGSVKFKVPEFETPPIETITPQFESVYTSNEQARSVDVTYNIGLLDPSVVPNPDDDGNSSYIDEPEIWQTETVINRISVAKGVSVPLSSHSKGIKENEPVDPTLPPVAPTETEAIYDSNNDPDWEAGLFGTITLNNLFDGSTYSGVTIYAEYDSFRPTDVSDPTATPVSSGTIGFVIDPFETDFLEPLTPSPDIDDPLDWLDHDGFDPLFPVDVIDPETVDPVDPVDPGDKEEGANIKKIVWILLLVLFTAITIAAVLYPMLKED